MPFGDISGVPVITGKQHSLKRHRADITHIMHRIPEPACLYYHSVLRKWWCLLVLGGHSSHTVCRTLTENRERRIQHTWDPAPHHLPSGPFSAEQSLFQPGLDIPRLLQDLGTDFVGTRLSLDRTEEEGRFVWWDLCPQGHSSQQNTPRWHRPVWTCAVQRHCSGGSHGWKPVKRNGVLSAEGRGPFPAELPYPDRCCICK